MIRDIKVNFARYYNRRHQWRGYFFWERFKGVIGDRGDTQVNYLAYIDLPKNEIKSKPITGLAGIYSLKRLSGSM